MNVKIWKAEYWFGFLLWLAIAAALCMIAMIIISDKAPSCYYLDSYMVPMGVAYQIRANVNWGSDSVAFISTDYMTILEAFDKLPKCGQNVP